MTENRELIDFICLKCLKIRKAGKAGMRKKQAGKQPFKWLTVGLVMATLVLLVRIPGKSVSLERQREALKEAKRAYQEEVARGKQIEAAKAYSETDEAIEQAARREYGYCWYGEIIYEVANLDEIESRFATPDEEGN